MASIVTNALAVALRFAMAARIRAVLTVGRSLVVLSQLLLFLMLLGNMSKLFRPLNPAGGRSNGAGELPDVQEQLRFQASLLDVITEAVIATDIEGRITFWNRAAAELYGWSAEEALGRRVVELLRQGVADNMDALFAVARTNGEWEGAFTLRRRDGSTVHIWSSGRQILDDSGKPIGLIGTSVDITKQRQLTEQLAQREQQFRTLVENIPDVIARYDRQHRHIYVSPSIIEVTGHHPEFYIGYTPQELHIHQETALVWRELIEATFRSGQSAGREVQVQTAHGLRHYEVRMVPEFGEGGAVVTVLEISRDITERVVMERALRASAGALRQLNAELEQRVQERTAELQATNEQLQQAVHDLEQAQRALRDSEERYRRIVETAAEGIWVADAAGRTVFVNAQMAAMIGYSSEEIVGRSVFDFVEPERFQQVEQQLERRKLGIVDRDETSMYHRDGRRVWIQIAASPFFDADGTYLGGVAMMTDITERKLAEERLEAAYKQLEEASASLRRSRDLLRVAFDGLDDGLALLAPDGMVLAANKALAQLLGVGAVEMISKGWGDVCAMRAPPFPATWALDEAGQRAGDRRRVRFERGEGEVLMLDVAVLVLRDSTGMVSFKVVTVVDVTERLQIEAQAIEQERFAANGRLAAIIAHEFNTPLQALESCLYIANQAKVSERRTYLATAQQEVQRIGAMTHQLLSLYRQENLVVQMIDLNLLVERLLILVHYTRQRQGVSLVTTFAPHMPRVVGRPDEMSQVVLNLVMNALQAMPNGGTLRISTEIVAELAIPIKGLREAACYLVLRVTDSGPGISHEFYERIFEPFFTTKADGAGLGLTVSQKIIAKLDGAITLVSRPGEGCTFSVWLPTDA